MSFMKPFMAHDLVSYTSSAVLSGTFLIDPGEFTAAGTSLGGLAEAAEAPLFAPLFMAPFRPSEADLGR